MQIISTQFLFFSIVVVAIYYLLTRRAQNIWLLLASYFFYALLSWKFFLALVLITAINYFIGRKVLSRGWLALGLLINLGAFSALKLLSGPYGPRLVGDGVAPDALALLLPIGFSFYILQAISYQLDIHRGQAKPAQNFVDFALYLSYFPKLLAGPIERPTRFLSALEADRRVDNESLARGLGLVCVGVLRKVIIADRLNSFLPATIFSDPASFSSLEKLLWLLVFTFGLYNDFAGYTNIVRGLSALMGIELSPNFRQPFFAQSISDFWTRWHISLSFWLRDYIFFPARRWLLQRRWPQWTAMILPPMLTMLASGFWHGAYATVLAWGALHGLFLISEQLLKISAARTGAKLRAIVASLFVFALTTLALAVFASSSLRAAGAYIFGLFSFSVGFSQIYIPWPDIILSIAFSFWFDWQEAKHESDAFFVKWTPRAQAWGFAIVIWLFILFLGPQAEAITFVYQGF